MTAGNLRRYGKDAGRRVDNPAFDLEVRARAFLI